MNYRDLAHASYHTAIHLKIDESLEILEDVNSLLKEVSELYQYFSEKLSATFSKFNKTQVKFTYSSDLFDLWSILLQYFSEEAKVYYDSSEDIGTLVCKPLNAVGVHKRRQSERLYDFICSADVIIHDESDTLERLHKEYVDQYLLQRENYDSKLIPGLLNAHNSYVLQMISVNKMKDQYHNQALPNVLDELENIQKDLIKIFQTSMSNNSGMISKKHQHLIDIQERISTAVKSHHPVDEITNFVKQLNSNQSVAYWRRELFLPPDGDCPEILARDDVISDKLTDDRLQHYKTSLVREQSELLSFISQNEDVVNTLRGLKENRSFEQLYELEDDICRKQNEVRIAQIHVSGIVAQILHIDCKRVTNSLFKDDESSGVRKIWRKAVFSLKRDKGIKHQSIFKNTKKDSQRPSSSPSPNTSTHDDSRIDPVYNLLRCAATKTVPSNNTSDASDCNSSPTPKYSEVAYQNSGSRLSLIQSAINIATLSRRRLLMSQTKLKSHSVDENGPQSSIKDSLLSDILVKDSKSYRGSVDYSGNGSGSSTPSQISRDSKCMPRTMIHALTTEDKIVDTSSPKNSRYQRFQRQRIDDRMKSISLDNPDHTRGSGSSPVLINSRSKKMSTSYTNTKVYESNVPLSPKRRKDVYGRNKSLSLDQDRHASQRRVVFDEDSLIRKEVNNLDNSDRFFKSSNEMISKSRRSSSQTRTPCHAWRVKSFSLDIPDTELTTNIDKTCKTSPSKSTLMAPSALSNGSASTPSPKHDSKRLDRISESLEKTLSVDADPQLSAATSGTQKILKYQKSHVDDTLSKQYSKVHGYRLSGNLYVALYDFFARQKDELQLRAGWKVSAIDVSDSDWWTGKCNGKFGYFPSNYVQALHQGEHVWRVIHEITCRDNEDNPVRLYKNQIIIQTGSQDNDQILIRSVKNTVFWCPMDCVSKVIDVFN